MYSERSELANYSEPANTASQQNTVSPQNTLQAIYGLVTAVQNVVVVALYGLMLVAFHVHGCYVCYHDTVQGDRMLAERERNKITI